MMTRENPITRSIKEKDMLGLTKGTRHYIQYDLTDGDGWQDLLFQNAEGNLAGLWCSRSYSAANARIEELMAECDTDRSQYRIVRRTWDETILAYNPNHGKAFNDPSFDYSHDENEAAEDEDEDDAAEADLEAQVGEVPDTGDNTGFELMNDSKE